MGYSDQRSAKIQSSFLTLSHISARQFCLGNLLGQSKIPNMHLDPFVRTPNI